MIYQLKKSIAPIGASLLILILLEIFSTTFLPIIGLTSYRIPFNILLSLYVSFKLDTIYPPLFIFMIHYIHSFFSVEGWETGTIAGVTACFTISYFKDIVHLSSYTTTVIFTQIFQFFWPCITGILLYFKGASISFLIDKFWRFIPESIFIAFMAPLIYPLLDKIWDVSDETTLRNDI